MERIYLSAVSFFLRPFPYCKGKTLLTFRWKHIRTVAFYSCVCVGGDSAAFFFFLTERSLPWSWVPWWKQGLVSTLHYYSTYSTLFNIHTWTFSEGTITTHRRMQHQCFFFLDIFLYKKKPKTYQWCLNVCLFTVHSRLVSMCVLVWDHTGIRSIICAGAYKLQWLVLWSPGVHQKKICYIRNLVSSGTDLKVDTVLHLWNTVGRNK